MKKNKNLVLALALILVSVWAGGCSDTQPTEQPAIQPTATVEVTEQPAIQPTATTEPTLEFTEQPTAQPTAPAGERAVQGWAVLAEKDDYSDVDMS
ncbi:MAG: hypothetical protein IMY75_08795, partial [Chloroflexi bacterium]|nr:hypothetical protein [Chloroflexota bacterium]